MRRRRGGGLVLARCAKSDYNFNIHAAPRSTEGDGSSSDDGGVNRVAAAAALEGRRYRRASGGVDQASLPAAGGAPGGGGGTAPTTAAAGRPQRVNYDDFNELFWGPACLLAAHYEGACVMRWARLEALLAGVEKTFPERAGWAPLALSLWRWLALQAALLHAVALVAEGVVAAGGGDLTAFPSCPSSPCWCAPWAAR